MEVISVKQPVSALGQKKVRNVAINLVPGCGCNFS